MMLSTRTARPVVSTLLCVLLCVPNVALASGPAEDDPMSEVKKLYDQGTAKYSAAEYADAVTLFTQALDELKASGVEDEMAVGIRGALLFNIARARVNAYDTDRDPSQLRKALAVYKRVVSEAEQGAGYPAEDVAEARKEIETLETRLAELDKQTANNNNTTTPGPVDDTEKNAAVDRERRAGKARGLGIGLIVTGVVFVGLGAGGMAWGSGFEKAAEEDVLQKAGNPPNYVFTADEEAHIADEKSKGLAWVGGGAAIAVLGVAGVGIGAWQLSKAKKIAKGNARITPVFGGSMVGLSVSGRF